MIKWTFFFDTGSVSSNIDTPEHDDELDDLVHEEGLILLPGKPQVYVNMKMVKAITREEVQDQSDLADEETERYIHADAQHDDVCTMMGRPVC